ncbi:transposase [Asticcacaulis taihuensis]|uniref:DDE superfamily endonuclease n=1 Tax=Asticcacaulis taihuensis TaxID=260084 RepID=A0A1G4SGH0_9CAUL|nr:transposase [Asticcacaulis taihuensis]SCW67419.1 DDE superfamily endonuclease [Asticcacaulis taihuensis]
MYQGRLDPRRLLFIDETWAKTNMAPLRGWCRKGQRLKAKAPFGHWQTMTFIAALRCDRIDAPCVFDGPINGRGFVDYVEQCLVPVLKRKRPVTAFGLRIELGEVLEIISEISPGLSTELSDYGADGDHYGRRTTPALA